MKFKPGFDTVERFAELAAQLGDSFVDRARVLDAAGLDELRLASLTADWITEFAKDADGTLARRFSEAFAAARLPLLGPSTTVPAPAPGPRFLNKEAQPWRDEAAAVGLDASGAAPPLAPFVDEATEDTVAPLRQPFFPDFDLDQTAELVVRRSGPDLPFAPVRAAESRAARPAPPSHVAPEPPQRLLDPTDATQEITLGALRSRPLPFATSMASARRLHSFDTRTGLPLAQPYWVDEPADPTKPR